MTRRLLLAFLATTGALAASAPARAAPSWSAPFDVSVAPAAGLRSPAIGFDTDGRGLFSWALDDNPLNRAFLTGLRSVAPNGALEPQRLSTDTIVDRPAFYAARSLAVLKRRTRGAGRGRLSVQFARTREANLGTTSVIDRNAGDGPAAIAGNPLGLIAVAYAERRPGQDIVWLAWRRPKGSFGKPVAIRRGSSFTHVAVGVGPGGKIVVAYQRAGRVEVRVRRPATAMDPPEDVGSGSGLQSLAVGVSQNAQAIVAFQAARGVAQQEAASVRAAILHAGDKRFARAVTFASGEFASGGDEPVRALIDSDGRATLAWTVGATGVWTARTSRGGIFAASHQLSAAGRLADLAQDPGGGTAVVWTEPLVGIPEAPPPPPSLMAALISRTGVIGPAETVVAGEPVASPAAAFNPQKPELSVVWLRAVEGGAMAVRAAVRSG